jgi:hypothetical protein
VALDYGSGALADLAQVLARLARVQQWHLAAYRAGGLERVIQLRQLWPQQLKAGVTVGQPQILVGGDVGEVPHERAHDRRV